MLGRRGDVTPQLQHREGRARKRDLRGGKCESSMRFAELKAARQYKRNGGWKPAAV
jgi:hypothetical protein